jgi:hypothetical protein
MDVISLDSIVDSTSSPPSFQAVWGQYGCVPLGTRRQFILKFTRYNCTRSEVARSFCHLSMALKPFIGPLPPFQFPDLLHSR